MLYTVPNGTESKRIVFFTNMVIADAINLTGPECIFSQHLKKKFSRYVRRLLQEHNDLIRYYSGRFHEDNNTAAGCLRALPGTGISPRVAVEA